VVNGYTNINILLFILDFARKGKGEIIEAEKG
jgi:hypothetical protein